MRTTPITKLTLAAAIAVAGLATSAAAQNATAPKAKVSSSTTIMKSGDGQSYEIKIQDGEVTLFKLNGKNVSSDRYKIDTEGGFIVLKDGDNEPIIIDIPHFDTSNLPAGFKGGIAEWPPRPEVARVPNAPRADNIQWLDAPDAPDAPAALTWVNKEPPKVMIGITHDSVSDELLEELGLESGEGIYVLDVRKDLPADKAGIKSGDVIIEVDGHRISKRDVLMDVMQKHEPGDKLTIIVLRDGEKKKLKLELAPYNSQRLGVEGNVLTRSLKPTAPNRFRIEIDGDDMDFGEDMDFGDFPDIEFFNDFDFDMEGLPPEARLELERALKMAREQAKEAQQRAFVFRRDTKQGQNPLHEIKIREQHDEMREHADRLHEHMELFNERSSKHAEEMAKLQERLARLHELGENEHLFRAAPNGRAFIIEGDAVGRDGSRSLAKAKVDADQLLVERDSLAARNHELERRVEDLERKLEELMKRLEKNESDRRR